MTSARPLRGYTRGAFYSNFESLDELFFALYHEEADRVMAHVTAALAAGADSDPSVAALIERIVPALPLDREWLMIKTEYLLHAARDPAIARLLADHRAQVCAAVEQRLALAAGRLAYPAPIPDTAGSVIAAYDGVAAQFLIDGDEQAARDRLRQVLAILLGQ